MRIQEKPIFFPATIYPEISAGTEHMQSRRIILITNEAP